MDFSGLDIQSLAMIGGFFVAGFAGVWIFLTLRQNENQKQSPGEDDRN